MKVIESEKPDRAGHYPIFFPKTATVSQIHDWLWHRFGGEGYKFVIVIDVSHDEYEQIDGVYVYFLGDLKEEVDEYVR